MKYWNCATLSILMVAAAGAVVLSGCGKDQIEKLKTENSSLKEKIKSQEKELARPKETQSGIETPKKSSDQLTNQALQRAVSEYYSKRGLTEGLQAVTCDFYGSTSKIGMGFTADGGGFVPKGATVYDCAPLYDTSIASCFAVLDSVPYSLTILGPSSMCSGERPIASKSGKYLPATFANVIHLIKDEIKKSESSNELDGATFTVTRRTDMSGLPDGADRDANHWFHVTWASDGATYDYDADPWTHEVYQKSLTLGGRSD